MEYSDNKAKDIQIVYIGDGSRGWAQIFTTGLALENQISGTIRLYDIDGGAARNNEVIGDRLMQRNDTKGDWKFETSTSFKSALTGYDFAVISILPGTFDEMESDVHFPERLGVCQSVGDTAGPDGMIHALRTIPMFVKITGTIKEYTPKVQVINCTNPMSLCVKTLYHVFPETKAFGCCHGDFGAQKVLKGICEESNGETGADWHDIHVDVLGINHFTWFPSASYRGVGLFPVYREYIDKHFDQEYEVEDGNWMSSSFKYTNRVKMDLFKRYGLITTAGDRHLAEFMSGNEYLGGPETVASWKFSLTMAQWRKSGLEERLGRSRRLASGEEEVELKPTDEEGILLIKALCDPTRAVSNVNIPSTAYQITNLPAGALAETSAVFEKDHVHPVVAGAVPENVKELLIPHLENHELIMEATLNPDREKVVRASMNDPLVKGKDCREEDARLLVDDMIKNTLRYLPKGWE